MENIMKILQNPETSYHMLQLLQYIHTHNKSNIKSTYNGSIWNPVYWGIIHNNQVTKPI